MLQQPFANLFPFHTIKNSRVYEGAKVSNERGFWVRVRGMYGWSVKS
jgi:hypothetical protein